MDITTYIREMIKEDYGSFRRFARIVDIPPSTLVTNLNKENGFGKMPIDMGMKICKELDLDINQIFNYDVKPLTPENRRLIEKYETLSRKSQGIVLKLINDLIELESDRKVTLIPMYSEPAQTTEIPYFDQAAGMGPGQYVQNAVMEKIEVASDEVPEGTDFAIRVVGDSMEPTYSSGDKLYIHKTDVLDVGDIGVFSVEGEQFVKELGNGELISHNKDYPPIPVGKGCYVQGKVLGKIKKDPAGGSGKA